MFEDDLTDQEREAFAGLPREAQLNDLLEERTIRLLQNRGLLASRNAKVIVVSLPRAVLAAAALLFMVLASFWVGRWSNAPAVEGIPPINQSQDLGWSAREVQRTGSAYILALEALAQAKRGNPQDLDQGREAALATFRAAAQRVLDLGPGPVEEGISMDNKKQEQVIWF